LVFARASLILTNNFLPLNEALYVKESVVEFWSAFGIFFFFLIMESVTSWIFIRGSKKHHNALWLHAGEPTLMGNGDMISAWPLNKYLMKRKYLELDEPLAVAFAEKNRLPFVITYFGACISVIVFFAVVYFYGTPQ